MSQASSAFQTLSVFTHNMLDDALSIPSSIKTFNFEDVKLDKEVIIKAWEAFGNFIFRNLRMGKGVSVQKFGLFTFSMQSYEADSQRKSDLSSKEPVFILSKDFDSNIKSGLVRDKPKGGVGILPFDHKQGQQNIPIVTLNFADISFLADCNKSAAKKSIWRIIDNIKTKARSGTTFKIDLPCVGQILAKQGMIGIIFSQDLHIHKRANSSSFTQYLKPLTQMNLQAHNTSLYSPDKPMRGTSHGVRSIAASTLSNFKTQLNDQGICSQILYLKQKITSLLTQTCPSYNDYQKDDYIRVIGLLLEHASPQKIRTVVNECYDSEFPQFILNITERIKIDRPITAASFKSSRYSFYQSTIGEDRANRLTTLSLCKEIFQCKQVLQDVLEKAFLNLRTKLTVSEILLYLKKAKVSITIKHLHEVLKTLGIEHQGPNVTFLEIFSKSMDVINELDMEQNDKKQRRKGPAEIAIAEVRDQVYSDKINVQELWSKHETEGRVKKSEIKRIIAKIVPNMRSDVIDQIIETLKGDDKIGHQSFIALLKPKLPNKHWENVALREIREWMTKCNLNSEQAFDMICKHRKNLLQKKMTIRDFTKGLQVNDFEFTKPQMDFLFTIIDANRDGYLDRDDWQTKIYDDFNNPLQMIREIIIANEISGEELLHKFRMKIYDDPLDFQQFREAMKKLDPELNNIQFKSMFNSLRSRDNKIELPKLLAELVGDKTDTQDFRNQVFKVIYKFVNQSENENKLKKYFELYDTNNDGTLDPHDFNRALRKLDIDLPSIEMERFIRFLDKTNKGRIDYMGFLNQMKNKVDKNHNPFKILLNRLYVFMKQNDISSQQLIRRISNKILAKQGSLADKSKTSGSEKSVPCEYFAKFLKAKVDKKREQKELIQLSSQIDLDKDGYIDINDLQTCLGQINHEGFFQRAPPKHSFSSNITPIKLKNQKYQTHKSQSDYKTNLSMRVEETTPLFPIEKLNEEKVIEVSRQIRQSLLNKRLSYREAFNVLDAKKTGLLSFPDFCEGLDQIISLSQPVKEKLFARMDAQSIGLVDYDNFLEILRQTTATQPKVKAIDNFNWEEQQIQALQKWIFTNKLSASEALRNFDRDFDGFMNLNDLKWALVNILNVQEKDIKATKLERLFRLLDHNKCERIQQSDIQVLMDSKRGASATSSSLMSRTSGISTKPSSNAYDWKAHAIQQIGLVLSSIYSSLDESFEQISERLQRITIEQFHKFIETKRALSGFNLTLQLVQQLFSEIDPHKKGYLTYNDWVQTFQLYDHTIQQLQEIKNLLSQSFTDVESAYKFFSAFAINDYEKRHRSVSPAAKRNTSLSDFRTSAAGGQGLKDITLVDFKKGVRALHASRFTERDLDKIWGKLSEAYESVNFTKFKQIFSNIPYTGTQQLRNIRSTGKTSLTSTQSSGNQSFQFGTSSNSFSVYEKFKTLVRTSKRKLEDVFQEIDTDGSGRLSAIELRHALKNLKINLSAAEIDSLVKRFDRNQDGLIDWKEFQSKFKPSENDDRLDSRSKFKIAKLREFMYKFMTSPKDAFSFFDSERSGKLTYGEFTQMVLKLFEKAREEPPVYPIIKDLFDQIDMRKDGIIDFNEWSQTFKQVENGDEKEVYGKSMMNKDMIQYENTKEYEEISAIIGKSRRLLQNNFDHYQIKNEASGIITFESAKVVLKNLLRQFDLDDLKYKTLLRVAEVTVGGGRDGSRPSTVINYKKFLDIYKNRIVAKEAFPKSSLHVTAPIAGTNTGMGKSGGQVQL